MEKKTDKETWDTEKRMNGVKREKKKGEKHKEMNKKMKGESEQRQPWWKRKKREKCWKTFNKKRLNKRWSFLSDFCGFKAKREEIKKQ